MSSYGYISTLISSPKVIKCFSGLFTNHSRFLNYLQLCIVKKYAISLKAILVENNEITSSISICEFDVQGGVENALTFQLKNILKTYLILQFEPFKLSTLEYNEENNSFDTICLVSYEFNDIYNSLSYSTKAFMIKNETESLICIIIRLYL